MFADEAHACGDLDVTLVEVDSAANDAELVIALGGDGTFLRATEFTRQTGTPMLGVNLGHVGFLAQAEQHDLSVAIQAIVDATYEIEERGTVDAEVIIDGETTATAWALNEASIERTNRERM